MSTMTFSYLLSVISVSLCELQCDKKANMNQRAQSNRIYSKIVLMFLCTLFVQPLLENWIYGGTVGFSAQAWTVFLPGR